METHFKIDDIVYWEFGEGKWIIKADKSHSVKIPLGPPVETKVPEGFDVLIMGIDGLPNTNLQGALYRHLILVND